MPGVYYREVAASDTDQNFDVIGYQSGESATFTANKVLVKDSVTKAMMDAFDTDKDGTLSDTEKAALPTLTFTAYAVQKDGLTTAANAWGQIPTT